MSESSEATAPQYRRLVVGAIVAIVAGLVIVVLGLGFDWSGFLGGCALGAGIGLALVGVYLWGYTNGLQRVAARPTWLPSRDGRG